MLSNRLIFLCVDTNKFSARGIKNHLVNNKEVVIDVLSLMDDIRCVLQDLTRIKLDLLQDDLLPSLIQNNLCDQNKKIDEGIAHIILTETSQSGYSRIRRSLIDHHNFTKKILPSYYFLAKQRPNFESFVVDDSDNKLFFASLPEDDINSTAYSPSRTNHATAPITPSSFIGNTEIKFEDALEQIQKENSKNKIISSAKLSGDYIDYCNLLVKKHRKHQRKVEGNVIVIDSYDGAMHKKTSNGKCSVISFSSQLINSDILKHDGVTAGNSLNILTWQQMIADEKPQYIYLAIETIFETKKEMKVKQAETSNHVILCTYSETKVQVHHAGQWPHKATCN